MIKDERLISEQRGEHMRGISDIFQAIEGIDENGEVKAICCLMVEERLDDIGLTPKVEKVAYMQDASVKVSLTSDLAVVDLGYEGYEDYDYRQALELCREFAAMTDACGLGKEPDSDPSLILCITPKRGGNFYLMGMDAVWSSISKKPEKMCDGIQLTFVREKFGTYKFRREQ